MRTLTTVGSFRLRFCAHPHGNTLGPRSLCGLHFYLHSSSMQGFVLQTSLENVEMLKAETRCADQASALENRGCRGLAGVGRDWGSSGRGKRCGAESGTGWSIPRAVPCKKSPEKCKRENWGCGDDLVGKGHFTKF